MQEALTQLEELAAAAKPPSLVALYSGSPAARKQTLAELEPRLQEQGLTVLTFNARRHLSEPDLGVPLSQQLLLLLQDLSNRDNTVTEITNRLMEGLDQLALVTHGTARMGAMHKFDAAMSKLLDQLVTHPPLVVLVQGVDMAAPGALLKLIEFMASYLDLPRCMFILALGERALEGDLREQGGGRMPYTPQEFLEETFTNVVSIGSAAAPQPASGPSLDARLGQKLAEVQALAPEFHSLAEERPELQPLPLVPFGAVLKLERRISHEGMVSVGGNYYSVPDATRRRVVEVHSLADEIRIFENDRLIACHPLLEGRRQRSLLDGHRRHQRRNDDLPLPHGFTGQQVARRSLDIYAAIGQQLAGARA